MSCPTTKPATIFKKENCIHGKIENMKKWQIWLGIVISAVFLYFALRGLHLEEVWGTIQTAQFIWLLPAVLVYFVGVWVRTWRWQYLLRPLKQIPNRVMFPIVNIGYLGNNIYPARAGEVLRAFVLRRREQVPVSASLATIIVERIFDGVVMLGFVFLNLGQLAHLQGTAGFVGNIQNLALWAGAAFAAALIIFLLAAMYPALAERLASFVIDRLVPARWRESLRGFTQRFLTGLESLRSPWEALMIFFTSVLIWSIETVVYWLVMQAFQFNISFFSLMLINGVVNLATMLPSAPGYIGIFEAPGIALLQAFGVAGGIAAGYTVVLHVTLWLPITLVGAIYFLREGLSWGQKISIDESQPTGV